MVCLDLPEMCKERVSRELLWNVYGVVRWGRIRDGGHSICLRRGGVFRQAELHHRGGRRR